MRAGALRQFATIQSPIKSRGDSGEEITTWSTVAVRSCSIVANKGAEPDVAGIGVRAVQQFVVRIRYEAALSTLSPEWQVVVNGTAYRITAVDNIGMRNREFKLECVADV